MEDFKRVVFDRNPEQAFFAIFDGHGGGDAADFARNHLWDAIKQQKGFYSGETSRVTKAIKDGFVATHREMWKHLGKLVSLSCHFALDTETCSMAEKDTLHDFDDSACHLSLFLGSYRKLRDTVCCPVSGHFSLRLQ